MSQTERRPFLALLRVPARYARVATGGLAVCALAVALLGQQALDRWPHAQVFDIPDVREDRPGRPSARRFTPIESRLRHFRDEVG